MPGACVPWGMHARGVCMPGGMYAGGACVPCTSPSGNRMTNACENITLPQTSFAGGYKHFLLTANRLQRQACEGIHLVLKLRV